MFPLNAATGMLQAAQEAEYDVDLLILATRRMPEEYLDHLHKYVAIALLAYLDVVRRLANAFDRQHARATALAALDEIKACREAMNRTAKAIEKPLRDDVRNLVGAHRWQQTVESVSRTHKAVTSPDMRRLLETTRTLLGALEGRPVWVWGRTRDRQGGIVAMVGSTERASTEQVPGPDAFRWRPHGGAQFELTEREFESYQEAQDWAAAFWPVSGGFPWRA